MRNSAGFRVLVGFGALATVAAVLPLGVSARTMFAGQSVPAERIAAAFSAAGVEEAAPTKVAQKGDLMQAECAGQVWPAIDARCLKNADGSRPARYRTVSAAANAGQNTTVLMRLPLSVVAMR